MVISAEPRADGALSVLSVDWPRNVVVLSTGEELRASSEKLLSLASELCQESAAVTCRTWWTKGGKGMVETLIEIHRERPEHTPTRPESASDADAPF